MNTKTALPLANGRIARVWWPLAASWLLMTAEMPMMAAVISRLPDPKTNLAAWGVVFPMALILASPIIMLLATSTTLSRDWGAFVTLRRYMYVLAFSLTGLHFLIAFTPLIDRVLVDLIAIPTDVVEPARLGFRLMLPWSFALAYRRFSYGVLIRFEHTRAVTTGSLVRLSVDALALTVLYRWGELPGITVATIAIIMGVVSEAFYAHWIVKPVLKNELRPVSATGDSITLPRFLRFYIPLVMTSVLQIVGQPIVSAALSRMPDPLQSLAVWPVIYGVLIMFMSAGIAYVEVVVVLLDEPYSLSRLRRFAMQLALILTAVLALINVTSLSAIWFERVVALPSELVEPARAALWLGLLVPGFAVVDGWFTGVIMNSQRTRGITEAVALGMVAAIVVLTIGVISGAFAGVIVGMFAMIASGLARIVWLWRRSQPAIRARSRVELRSPWPVAQH